MGTVLAFLAGVGLLPSLWAGYIGVIRLSDWLRANFHPVAHDRRDIEAVSVQFALRQNAGCWWIEL